MQISMKYIRTAILAIAVSVICSFNSTAFGDEIIMRDGTVHIGTVVTKSRRSVVIDTTINGIETRLTLDRRQIKSIVEGDTPTTPVNTGTNTPTLSIPAATIEKKEAPKVVKRDGYNLILEVPLKGTFGEDIYPLVVANSLEWAKEHGVTDVVFRINSGGGAIWCSDDMVEIMKNYRGEFKMHMLIESAISASIWPTFNCDTISMTPGSDFGGAVVYRTNDTGSAEVDKKMNGIMSAKLESTAESNGYSPYLVRAMILSEAAVYAYQKNGEWVLTDTTEGIPENYETIDGPDTVLTLTAQQAVKYGIADAMENRSIEEFARVQGIEKWDYAGKIGFEIAERDVAKSKKLQAELFAIVRSFNTDTNWMASSNNLAEMGSSLKNMKKNLGQYKRLLKKAEDYHMPSILSAVDGAIDVPFWENRIKRMSEDIRRLRKQSRRGP